MTAKTVRVIIRWIHIVGGAVIMCYIYSPFHENVEFQCAVKFGVLPILTFTGIWLWKFRQFNRFFRIQS